MLLAFLLALAAPAPPGIVGSIPPALDGPRRVVWIGVDTAADEVKCGIAAPARWSCEGLQANTRGLVVLVGESAVAATAIGLAPIDPTPARWGRIVRITPGGASPDDLHDLTLAAFRPERPRVRPWSVRFSAVTDDEVRVAKLSETTFWVSGGRIDPDAFLALDGPTIGSQRVSTPRLSEGPPDEPVYLTADAPVPINGRVHGSRGEPADNADVELWELVRWDEQPPRLDDGTPLVRRATVSTSFDGAFQFDRAAGGTMLIAAAHAVLGAGRVWVTRPGPVVDLQLTPPARATGRVLRRNLPVAGALVRFVPDADAFSASRDPMEHIALEVRTRDDGTFSLALPPKHAGIVQIVTDEGGRARVAIPDVRTKGDIPLGDIAVPDSAHLTVRLIDGNGCDVVAIGPLGTLGLAMVRAASFTSVYELELPEAGTWSLAAECGRTTRGVDPPIVVAAADRAATVVEARVVKTPG